MLKQSNINYLYISWLDIICPIIIMPKKRITKTDRNKNKKTLANNIELAKSQPNQKTTSGNNVEPIKSQPNQKTTSGNNVEPAKINSSEISTINDKAAKPLLDEKIKIVDPDDPLMGYSSVFLAVDYYSVMGDANRIKELVDRGVDQQTLNHALKYACLYGNQQNDLVKFLLKNGAQPCFCQDTPLRWSCMGENSNAVTLLLRYGAEIKNVIEHAYYNRNKYLRHYLMNNFDVVTLATNEKFSQKFIDWYMEEII